MIFKNIHIALRFLLKHKEYTIINILGLTLSLVCVLFIGLYIYDETSFDKFHSKANRIYRVIESETSDKGVTSRLADVPFSISMLGDQLPSIESSVKITTIGRANFLNDENENKLYEPFTISEQCFFDIFDFKIINGSKENALKESHSVVITKSIAEKMFGSVDVVNKLIRTDRDPQPYKITAVLDDFPANSHLKANMIFSFESFASANWYKQGMAGDWNSNFYTTYILAKENADIKNIAETITGIVTQNRDQKTAKSIFELQPLQQIHFHSADIRGGYAENPGEIYYIYIFGAVGLFILIISCINYINLSTSLSVTRGKEVGVKKVAGAGRYHLIAQFITESNLITVAALLLTFVIVNSMIPAFNTFVEKNISPSILFEPKALLIISGFTLFVGTVSGSYPAFYLSKFKPAIAIKGFASLGAAKGNVRQGLVVFQFALSIVLILATLIAQQQLSFIQNKNLGFKEDQLVVLDINSGRVRNGYQTIKNELAKISVVKDVSVSSRVPGEWKNIPQVGVRSLGNEDASHLFFMGADDAFLKTFQIELVAGRNFSEKISTDSAAFLINEAAARALGLSDPLNENIDITSVNYAVDETPLKEPFKGKIIGVVKDFHFQSLHQSISPLIISYHNNPIQSIDYFSVRLTPGDWQAALKDMEKALQVVDPSHLIEYNFLDQRLQDFYSQDVKRGQLFTLAAMVSIGLACLGLFSLVSFMTEQRTKEIGIRKALGATTVQIVGMLSSGYVKLVLISFVLATPVALWAINEWLQSFAYRININWLTIVVACVISVLVAFVTVGYKSYKAALENPIKSLRSE